MARRRALTAAVLTAACGLACCDKPASSGGSGGSSRGISSGAESGAASGGGGSSRTAAAPKQGAETARVRIKGKEFRLELAIEDAVRIKGLGGRDRIDEDGGMLFVFPRPVRQSFVMRDCPVAIDIAYLDGAGRVLTMHEMTPEEPRKEGETAQAYEERLKKYDSRFPAQFVVEVAGGTLRRLGLAAGDLVELDAEGLKGRAR